MEVKNTVCLNCGATLVGNFCSSCGQSAKVHRFTLTHVFRHDFLQRIIHIDKGFFFSIKELFTRPGHSVREYIGGKRVSHLNYFSLLVILILLFSMISEVTPFHFADLSDDEKVMVSSIEELVKNHPKMVYIGIIPLYAICSFMLFRKARQNYAEHFVLNTFKGSALLILTTLFIAIASLLRDTTVISRVEHALNLVMFGYGTWFYYQYFSPFYRSKLLLIFRSFLCATMPVALITIGVLIYILAVSPGLR